MIAVGILRPSADGTTSRVEPSWRYRAFTSQTSFEVAVSRFRQRELGLYTDCMADPITFRPTAEDAENLAILTADGTSPTHAIRHALEIAAHNKRQEDLRADAARLAASPEYQAEIRAVREELDELRAW